MSTTCLPPCPSNALYHLLENRISPIKSGWPFLTATPHNGHSNNFSSLLEMLDPQRFTRGVPVRPTDLDPVIVRRLKADLRTLGETFPERVVESIVLSGLLESAPELVLARKLADYENLRERRLANLSRPEAARARLADLLRASAAAVVVHRRVQKNLVGASTNPACRHCPARLSRSRRRRLARPARHCLGAGEAEP